MPSLFVYHGPDQGALFEIELRHQGVGRDASNGICLHDQTVCHEHASLVFDGTICTIVDLDGSTGTFVNGHRIDGAHRLASGDRVQVGGTIMLFTDDAASPTWITEWLQRFGRH